MNLSSPLSRVSALSSRPVSTRKTLTKWAIYSIRSCLIGLILVSISRRQSRNSNSSRSSIRTRNCFKDKEIFLQPSSVEIGRRSKLSSLGSIVLRQLLV